ncbi:hypothetical protein D9M72_546710 [compost metagenome]
MIIGRDHIGADALARQRRRDSRSQTNGFQRRMHIERDAPKQRTVIEPRLVRSTAGKDQREPLILAISGERLQRLVARLIAVGDGAVDIGLRKQHRVHRRQEFCEIRFASHDIFPVCASDRLKW